MSLEIVTVFGINSVAARLRRPGGLVRLVLREGASSRRLDEIETLANKVGCPVERQAESELDRVARGNHQGAVLLVESSTLANEQLLGEIIANADTALLFLVLDGVTDPRNLGACIRSAASLGVDAVIVPKDNSAPLNAAAIKTASGGASLVPVVQVVNLARCLEQLQKANVWIMGTLLETEQTIDQVDLTGHMAIVMGSEEKGLRKNTIKHCDFLARIPMAQDELGFNVSVAAGICLYEASRQRLAKSG